VGHVVRMDDIRNDSICFGRKDSWEETALKSKV
jgi:hypothetical protein